MRFRDRASAGRHLADRLMGLAGQPGLVVLALPRGGVPVAFEVAQALRAPLDVFVVRKLGVPGQEELAMGALASGGIRVLNRQIIDALHISDSTIEEVTQREQRELERRENVYRPGVPPLDARGKTVILVDDGIATGSTMRAAIAALRAREAARVIVATPTISRLTEVEMQPEVDALIAVISPETFHGVGQWYEDFSQTSDEEVRALLEQAQPHPHPP